MHTAIILAPPNPHHHHHRRRRSRRCCCCRSARHEIAFVVVRHTQKKRSITSTISLASQHRIPRTNICNFLKCHHILLYFSISFYVCTSSYSIYLQRHSLLCISRSLVFIRGNKKCHLMFYTHRYIAL